MTTQEWQTTFTQAGAVLQNGAIAHFGDAEAELKATQTGTVLCDCSHLGLLELDGLDAVTFLQGQVTNDVKLLGFANPTNSSAHYTGYCNPKGRLLALFLAFSHYGHLHLQLPKSLVEPILKRLKMYVMRAKVNIQDASDDTIQFGLNSPQAAALLAPLFTQVPIEDYQLVSLDNGAILKLPTTFGTRYQIFTKLEHASSIFNALKQHATLVGKPCWDYLEIHAGIPEVVAETQEQFVPQMLNLDAFNAINYKKGCYTGQEIVARTHYLGTVKRRTFLASIVSESAPLAGDKLLDATDAEVGQIVRVAPNLQAGFDVLAELRIDAQQTGVITWQAKPLAFKALPYLVKT